MPSHRSLRFAEAIREVVASAILFDVADPRVRAVTVLRVEVGGDLRTAVAYVSVMGTEAEQRLAMAGLRSASGFLQSRVAARIQARFTPTLTFKLDTSVKRSVEMSKLIEDTLAADRLATASQAPAEAASPSGVEGTPAPGNDDAPTSVDPDTP